MVAKKVGVFKEEDSIVKTINDVDMVSSGLKEEAGRCEQAMFFSRSCSYKVVADDDMVLDYVPDELTAYRSYFLMGTYSKTTNEIVHVELVAADKILLFLGALSNIRVDEFIRNQKSTSFLNFPKEFRYVVLGLIDKATLEYKPIEFALEKSFYDRLPFAVQSYLDNKESISSQGVSMPM